MLKAKKLFSALAKPCLSKVTFCTTTTTSGNISLYEKFRGFRNVALEGVNIPGVTIVNTKEKAKRALDVLMSLEDRYF